MKNLLIASNAILLALLIITWLKCCQKDPCAKCPQPSPECSIISGEELTIHDGSQILLTTATEMYNSYKNDPSKAWIGGRRQDDSSYMDALMLQIPMARMKHFIWYVEKKLCEAGCSDESKLAIRAFYAKYPSNVGTPGGPEDLRSVPEKYRNKHTLFFMPMFWNEEKNKWIAFDADFITTPCNIPERVTDGTPGTDRHVWHWMASGIDEDGSNHGGLHPPPYDTGSLTFPLR